MFMPSSNPRPILKQHHQQPASYHHQVVNRAPCAVRFPSSPKISTVHFTHCASSYDRRPIVVAPNSCELPDRGCRDYSAGTSPHTGQTQSSSVWAGNHVHPSLLMCANGSSSSSSEDDRFDVQYGRRGRGGSADGGDYGWYSDPPALTHDDASSEESDGIASPPPEQHHSSTTRAGYYLPPSQSHLHSEPFSHPPIPDSMSFLPHAPPEKKKRSSKHPHPTRSFTWSPSTTADEDSSCLGGF